MGNLFWDLFQSSFGVCFACSTLIEIIKLRLCEIGYCSLVPLPAPFLSIMPYPRSNSAQIRPGKGNKNNSIFFPLRYCRGLVPLDVLETAPDHFYGVIFSLPEIFQFSVDTPVVVSVDVLLAALFSAARPFRC